MTLAKNPVMFVVEVGAALTTHSDVPDHRSRAARASGFEVQIAAWLWFTVLFANFAEAMAEGRGKAQADSLRKTKTEMPWRRSSVTTAKVEVVPASALRKGDVVPVRTERRDSRRWRRDRRHRQRG